MAGVGLPSVDVDTDKFVLVALVLERLDSLESLLALVLWQAHDLLHLSFALFVGSQTALLPHNFMIGVRLEVQDVRELHPVVKLHVLAGLHVKSEPLEM